jgi:hypothetical protein
VFGRIALESWFAGDFNDMLPDCYPNFDVFQELRAW